MEANTQNKQKEEFYIMNQGVSDFPLILILLISANKSAGCYRRTAF